MKVLLYFVGLIGTIIEINCTLRVLQGELQLPFNEKSGLQHPTII